MSEEPFFRRSGASFIPTPSCRGPWNPNSLHGRVIAGLLGAEIERVYGDPSFQFTRLTTDLWRLPGFEPIDVELRLEREGGRIKVVEAEAFAGGVSIGRSSGVLLRRGPVPEGEIWSPEPWDFPKPEAIPPPPPANVRDDWRPMWETRALAPSFGVATKKQLWMREVHPLIEGGVLTPFQRVALAADFASPMANSGTNGLGYINTDITLYLHRLPVTEWIGFETLAHHAAEGVAVGECMLYDEAGAIGRSIVAALAQKQQR